METLSAKKFKELKHVYMMQIIDGAVFVYPTDTVYGIGCDATNNASVRNIRELKKTTHPFSVIAPSPAWIKENCVLTEEAEEYLGRLPGPYTLILKLKNRSCVAKEVSHNGTLGVRMPDHWIYEIIGELKKPIVTTSVNTSGQKPSHDLEEVPERIKKGVVFAIDEGKIENAPSTVIDFTGKAPKKLR